MLTTTRLTHLLASVELSLLPYAHDIQKFQQLQAHSTLGRSGATYGHDLVSAAKLVATRNSNNVRSSDSVKTIRMGAGIREIAPVQNTNLFYLTFYCSRLLSNAFLIARSLGLSSALLPNGAFLFRFDSLAWLPTGAVTFNRGCTHPHAPETH